MLYSPFIANKVLADLHEQYLMGIEFRWSRDVNSLPVYIEADNAEVSANDATIKGNGIWNNHTLSVQVKQSETNQPLRTAYVRNGFDYKDNQINMLGKNAEFNLDVVTMVI